jgi:hypothetical protein
MTDSNIQFQRLAIITELVKKASGGFGRTALMKCLFFLKTLRNVPLPYSFRLYTYGPFDGDVLEDLQYAESLGAIKSTGVSYPGGYGYEFRVGPQAGRLEGQASEFVSQQQENIDWVLNEFGNRSALDLEMASTLVYIDHALAGQGTTVSITDLAKKVHAVKPHLLIDAIEMEAQKLSERGYLKAVT